MSQSRSENVTWHAGTVSPSQRRANMGQAGATVWMTGRSGSGKSTVAVALEHELLQAGRHAYRLDGDNVRHGLCGDLGFSPEDREENNRRVGEVAKLFSDAGMVTLCSFISPYRHSRDAIRKMHEEAGLAFFEVYVDCPLEVAQERDPKGLYEKVRKGEIRNFTGVDAPFEAPERPELVLRTDQMSVEASVRALLELLEPVLER